MDVFENHAVSLDSPAIRHFEIAPDDAADLARRPRALRVQTGGTLVLRDEVGTNVTYTVFAGEILPLRPVRVLATGTTATAVGWE